MKARFALVASFAAVMLVGQALAAEALESGPQVGDRFPGAFHPLNVTNCENPKVAGKKSCFV